MVQWYFNDHPKTHKITKVSKDITFGGSGVCGGNSKSSCPVLYTSKEKLVCITRNKLTVVDFNPVDTPRLSSFWSSCNSFRYLLFNKKQ